MSDEDNWADAHRRVCIAAKYPGFDLSKVWVGYDYPSRMKKMVHVDGYMKPYEGKETPRVIGWYLFTEKGIEEYKRRFGGKKDFFDAAYDGPRGNWEVAAWKT